MRDNIHLCSSLSAFVEEAQRHREMMKALMGPAYQLRQQQEEMKRVFGVAHNLHLRQQEDLRAALGASQAIYRDLQQRRTEIMGVFASAQEAVDVVRESTEFDTGWKESIHTIRALTKVASVGVGALDRHSALLRVFSAERGDSIESYADDSEVVRKPSIMALRELIAVILFLAQLSLRHVDNRTMQNEFEAIRREIAKTEHTLEEIQPQLHVATTRLNCREAPSLKARVVKVLPASSLVVVHRARDRWLFVELCGEREERAEGWVYQEYVVPVTGTSCEQ